MATALSVFLWANLIIVDSRLLFFECRECLLFLLWGCVFSILLIAAQDNYFRKIKRKRKRGMIIFNACLNICCTGGFSQRGYLGCMKPRRIFFSPCWCFPKKSLWYHKPPLPLLSVPCWRPCGQAYTNNQQRDMN